MAEPWSYQSILKAIEFLKTKLEPACLEIEAVFNKHPIQRWKMLRALNRSHPDLKLLRSKQRNLKVVWASRPRFPLEKGRVGKEGY